jgi:SAM-dependent methyltransferase
MAESRSLKREIRDAAFTGVRYTWSRLNDFYLNIETADEQNFDDYDRERGFPFAKRCDGARHNDGIIYQAGNYWNIRRIIGVLDVSADDVFYDIGCGKGRCLCMLARLPIRRVVGIELDPVLVSAARKNAERLRRRRAPIEVRCQDAATADYSEGTIYFLYSPFGPATMRDVLNGIQKSLVVQPRKITIIYYNAMFGDVLLTCGWLDPVHELKTPIGHYPITFFVNRLLTA